MDGSMIKQLRKGLARLLYRGAALSERIPLAIDALADWIDPDLEVTFNPDTLTPSMIADEALAQLDDNLHFAKHAIGRFPQDG